jgi:hypothetical protein
MSHSSQVMALGRTGAFPRTEIKPDETVLFEGKPALVSITLYGIIFLLLCVLCAVLMIALTVYLAMCSLGFIIVGILPFVYFYVQWSGTAFAITTKRVLLEKTDSSLHRTMVMLPIYNITHTVSSQSFFDQLLNAGNIGFSPTGGLPGFMWPSVKDHVTVKAFVDEQIAKNKAAAPPPMAYAPPPTMYGAPVYGMQVAPSPYMVQSMPQGRICQTCGRTYDSTGNFCPYCGGRA